MNESIIHGILGIIERGRNWTLSVRKITLFTYQVPKKQIIVSGEYCKEGTWAQGNQQLNNTNYTLQTTL